ncbi:MULTISPECIES: hypothetical protein [unclassified Sphingomonas]|jgi:hypothetical protein|uniref:hypothetical protein n=1 Tax=unclassified Sphingomonas TaxID=196159 RepID=UPI001E364BFD|nr:MULTISPECIES: hypothetical protein [unclassified Sphingomonas]
MALVSKACLAASVGEANAAADQRFAQFEPPLDDVGMRGQTRAEASDAERQEFAEALLLQAAMLGSGLDQWAREPEMLERLAKAARQGALASGLDLAKMTLTPDGFVSRR